MAKQRGLVMSRRAEFVAAFHRTVWRYVQQPYTQRCNVCEMQMPADITVFELQVGQGERIATICRRCAYAHHIDAEVLLPWP